MAKSEIIKQCSVVLTRNCNLRCNFCYVHDAGYCPDDNVDYENLKKIVDFCCDAKAKFIFFTGGEPLLYPHLLEILQYIKKKEHRLIPAIASNGIRLGDANFCKNLIDCGLEYIDISMKGINPQEWIDTTGFDGYLAQQQAIKNLSKFAIDFTCSMVITSKNVFSLCDSVKNSLKCGAKQFSFTFVIDNNVNDEKNLAYLEKHNPLMLIENFISQVEYLNSITNEWWIEYSFPLCMYTEQQLKVLQGRLASPCQIHKNNAITFDTQLNLLPCDMYFGNKIGKLGEDFISIEDFVSWRSKDLYKKTLNSIEQLPAKKCKQCQYLKRCFGGCPVLWKNYSFEDLEKFKDRYQ